MTTVTNIDQMKISEKYQMGKFHILLLSAISEFFKEHLDASIKNKEVDYSTYGNPKQIKLKLIYQLSNRINSVLYDLDLTFIFLNKERKLISEHYRDLESQEDYYNYHLENYYIRLVTLLDIIGKLGNEVYNLGLSVDKVSAYVFKDKAKKVGFNKIAEIVKNLTDKIADYKMARHSKLHTGESDFKIFREIVIWEDLAEIINYNVDPMVSNYTDKEIKQKLEELKAFTIDVIQLIETFMDEASTKLEEFINEGNS